MQVIGALWIRGLKAFLRNRIGLAFSLILPFFFVYVFSAIFKNDFIENPVTFMLAGIVIVTVFESSLNIASSTVDDMVSGFMKEVLVSPAKRYYVAIGQLLSAATVGTFQGILILVLGLFIGIKFTSILTVIYVLLTMIIVGMVFSGVGLFLATKVNSGQTFQIVKTAISMPLTFLSGAYIPLSMIPKSLRFIAYLNPMTYATSFFRMIILEKSNSDLETLVNEGIAIKINDYIISPFLSFGILVFIGIVFLFLATNSFLKTDFSKIKRSISDGSAIWG